jgi:hypothetical protein
MKGRIMTFRGGRSAAEELFGSSWERDDEDRYWINVMLNGLLPADTERLRTKLRPIFGITARSSNT